MIHRPRSFSSSGFLAGAQLGAVECAVSEPFFETGTFSQSAGSVGQHVQSLQWYLREWGYYTGALDGYFGPKTAAAVEAFQTEAGIAVDGVVGPETQGALCDAVTNWTFESDPFPTGGNGDDTGSGNDPGNGNDGDNPGNGGPGNGKPGNQGGSNQGSSQGMTEGQNWLLYGGAAVAGLGLAAYFKRQQR